MAKSHRLYVSFHQDDNVKSKNRSGWVDDLIRVLNVFLNRINRESPEIIALDASSKAPANLEDGDGLVIIASDNYLNNKVYQRDVSLLQYPDRIFKVDLNPLNRSSLPKELLGLNEFQFFGASGKKDKSFNTLNGINTVQEYGLKVIDLTFEVARALYKRSISSESESEGRVVFLAETSYDRIVNRDEIKRELRRHGIEVLPKVPFSHDLKEFESQVQECLEKADLTVQFIGEEYGECPVGSDKSNVEIQNDLATQYYSRTVSESEHSLHRLIWMPLYLKPSSDQQKLYLDRLRDDISSTAGAEIIQTPLEILKTIIHSRLQLFIKEKLASQKRVKDKSDKKSVYLLFDQKDASDVDVLIGEMNKRDISVILPDFAGKQIELLQKHRESLINSDGVLLFANQNVNWLNSKLNDVVKAPGFGKLFPFEAKAIIIKNASIPKERIPNFDDLIMLNGGGKDDKITDLGPFIDKIAVQ